MEIRIQKSEHRRSVQLNEFSHTEHTCNQHSYHYPKTPLVPLPHQETPNGGPYSDFYQHRLVVPAFVLYVNRITQCISFILPCNKLPRTPWI